MKTDYLTTDDIQHRGWTVRQVAQFLPVPDQTGRSRFGKTVKRYHLDRVTAVEQTPEFMASRAKVAARQAAGKRAAEARASRRAGG